MASAPGGRATSAGVGEARPPGQDSSSRRDEIRELRQKLEERQLALQSMTAPMEDESVGQASTAVDAFGANPAADSGAEPLAMQVALLHQQIQSQNQQILLLLQQQQQQPPTEPLLPPLPEQQLPGAAAMPTLELDCE